MQSPTQQQWLLCILGGLILSFYYPNLPSCLMKEQLRSPSALFSMPQFIWIPREPIPKHQATEGLMPRSWSRSSAVTTAIVEYFPYHQSRRWYLTLPMDYFWLLMSIKSNFKKQTCLLFRKILDIKCNILNSQRAPKIVLRKGIWC